MKIIALIFYTSIFCNPAISQGLHNGKNLIQNSSFEEIDSCTGNWYGILFLKKWWPPNGPASSYYNACAPRPDSVPYSPNVPYAGSMSNYQHANSGYAYVGLGTRFIYDARDNATGYIENTLLNSLETNKEYCIEFYVNLPNFMVNNSNLNQSMLAYKYVTGLFSDTSISTFPGNNSAVYYYDYEASFRAFTSDSSYILDTLKWVRMFAQFVAKGGERYFTLGSFKTPRADFYVISNPDAISALAYVYIDDVAVYKGNCREEEKLQKTFFNLYPNPSSGLFSLNYGVAQDAQLVVYDILGRTVLNEPLAADKVLYHFNLSQMSNGMYFLKVISMDEENLYSQKFLLQR